MVQKRDHQTEPLLVDSLVVPEKVRIDCLEPVAMTSSLSSLKKNARYSFLSCCFRFHEKCACHLRPCVLCTCTPTALIEMSYRDFLYSYILTIKTPDIIEYLVGKAGGAIMKYKDPTTL